MSKFNYRNITLLALTSCVLVGCNNNQTNNYENKPIIETEIESESLISTEKQEDINNSYTDINSETEVSSEIEEIPTEEVITDEQVIEYINKVGDEINNCTDGITENAKKGFITVVDFLFYGGEIGGRTFESLKEETKTKALEIYDSISTYLDGKLPIWKESLGEKYELAKEYWNENKETIFDALESGKQKIKDWYEEFKNKHQN